MVIPTYGSGVEVGVGVGKGVGVWDGVGRGMVDVGARGVSIAGAGVLGAVQLVVNRRMKVKMMMVEDLVDRLPESGEIIP